MTRFLPWAGAVLVAAAAGWPAETHAQSPGKAHNHAGHSHSHTHRTEKDIKLPRDFASAVARLRTCGNTLQEELTAQRYDQAHAALDEATIVLGRLMPLARESGVPKSRWLEINTAGKDLKKRLHEVDDALHDSGKADAAAVTKSIDPSLKKLEAVADEHGLTRQAKKP